MKTTTPVRYRILTELFDSIETECERLVVDVKRLRQNEKIGVNQIARLKERIVWLQGEVAVLQGEGQ
jgi:hypothetical protein